MDMMLLDTGDTNTVCESEARTKKLWMLEMSMKEVFNMACLERLVDRWKQPLVP